MCDGVPALRVVPQHGVAEDGPVVLHLHGGCYTMGSAEGAIDLASRLAETIGGWALVPDYRLAPEHAYPAALDDVAAVYGWLAREHGAERIVVSGECAGGGLAIAMALRVRDAGATLPAALHAVSPFCDLTLTSPAANEMLGSGSVAGPRSAPPVRRFVHPHRGPGDAAHLPGERRPARPAPAANPGGRGRGAA